MLKISSTQLNALEDARFDTFRNRIVADVVASLPDVASSWRRADLERAVSADLRDARAHGLTRNSQMRRFAMISARYGFGLAGQAFARTILQSDTSTRIKLDDLNAEVEAATLRSAQRQDLRRAA